MNDILNHTAPLLAIIASGTFFMSGLLTGAWKYFSMTASENYRAPFYVDVAHRASLMYSFAALVVALFAYYSVFPTWVNITATALPLVFFALSIVLYISLGLKDETNNQLRDDKNPSASAIGMIALMVSEIGGFAVLFAGFILHII